ncbi:Lrp/AsnC family transcriptional regulator [Pengzhenrongella frigida]|uniref:Lrp/AsnC family transcriptional regulator n=1 Tax=Pengzhenrongella frigida TaxID=1259133 RepID=A0A4Q5MYA3_9MICO|nr:Lrp/AsnC family transcriptional regulator [Cellulomonas sp. HLT2-17]RYV50616.1 Lrp/AsnC family transcriptional regulator [Cellulomonas sp. HLT2-17]
MDAIDREILRELTADARLSFRTLGSRVGLSANAAAARVRRLQKEGRIRGFTILTGPDPVRTGAPGTLAQSGLEVFIDLRLRPEVTYEHFAASRASGAFPEILDAVHLTGGFDYLVHAVVPDAAALDRLVRRLKSEAGVAQSLTRLAMRTPPPAP